MLWRLLPMKWIFRMAAKRYGIIDPLEVLGRIRSFSKPSEVKEPIELLRAGILFQARGLVNTRAIQFNLDWVWPYWVHRQFDPADMSFIPRAYSFTHVNLTHRNWTAVGLPDLPLYPLVAPRGLVTPLYDGWSIDFWILGDDGARLLPATLTAPESDVSQKYAWETAGDADTLRLVTRTSAKEMRLQTEAAMAMEEGEPVLQCAATAYAPQGGWLAISVRPYNPEGVQFIETIEWDKDAATWCVNGEDRIRLDTAPHDVLFSNFEAGDVLHKLLSADREDAAGDAVRCRVGMATSAARYRLEPGEERTVSLRVPLGRELKRQYPEARVQSTGWREALSGVCRLDVPDPRLRQLFSSAVTTLVQLSAYEIVPGPFNYRRFWFRDAVLMSNALILMGLGRRVRPHLDNFVNLQKSNGYFRSQEGEWDSNGQVLWLYERYCAMTGEQPDAAWLRALRKGARWIQEKRVTNAQGERHNGLFPAGFSAEHLGPNDYYYWDDYWGIAGLQALTRLERRWGDKSQAEAWEAEASDFTRAVDSSIAAIPRAMAGGAIPASPYRRMDAGAIGSMVADYPLALVAADDPRIHGTLEFLLEHCFFKGGFFQDMVHSGVNCYLTCAIAQTLLRKGDLRFGGIIDALASMASPTGHWPEAVHPFSGGGCMGDGQHGWAAAEWALLMRNLFVREEGDMLVLGGGILPRWLEKGAVSLGPTQTSWGPVSVFCERKDGAAYLTLEAAWREGKPQLVIAVPGYARVRVATGDATREWKLEPIV